MSAPIVPPMPPMPDEPGTSFEEALAAALSGTPDVAKGPTADDVLAAAGDSVVPPPVAAAAVAAPTPDAAPAKPEPIPQALLDREAALEAREKALRVAEAAAKEAPKAPAVAFDIAAFRKNPVRHIRAMQPELTQAEAAAIAESFYMDALGNAAPIEHRVNHQVAEVESATNAKLEELNAKIAAAENTIREAQYAARRAEYRAELAASATALDAAAHPILSGIAKRSPEKYQELLYAEAVRIARESADAGAKEPLVPTATQVAAVVEAALKAHRDELYGPVTESAHATQSPSQTLSNRDASIQPNRTPPDTLDDRTLRAAALKAAGLGHLPVWD